MVETKCQGPWRDPLQSSPLNRAWLPEAKNWVPTDFMECWEHYSVRYSRGLYITGVTKKGILIFGTNSSKKTFIGAIQGHLMIHHCIGGKGAVGAHAYPKPNLKP